MNVPNSLKSMSMKTMICDDVLRNGLSTLSFKNTEYLPGPSDQSSTSEHGRAPSVFSTMNKLVKRKLSSGAKMLQPGGVEKLFRRVFSVREGEKLLKASQCSLYTSAGPVQGRLFISTETLAFCSDRAVAKYVSPSGELLRFHYKVVIPVRKIKRSIQRENVKKPPSQKYIQVTTTDDYEFWFLGFLNYKGTFKCLKEAVSENRSN